MSRLSEIKWNDGHGLEDLKCWGVEQIKGLAEVLTDLEVVSSAADFDIRISAIAYAILETAEDMEKVIDRFLKEAP